MSGSSKTYRNNVGAGRNGYWLVPSSPGLRGPKTPIDPLVGEGTSPTRIANAYTAAVLDVKAKMSTNANYGDNALVIDAGCVWTGTDFVYWIVVLPDVRAAWTPFVTP